MSIQTLTKEELKSDLQDRFSASYGSFKLGEPISKSVHDAIRAWIWFNFDVVYDKGYSDGLHAQAVLQNKI